MKTDGNLLVHQFSFHLLKKKKKKSNLSCLLFSFFFVYFSSFFASLFSAFDYPSLPTLFLSLLFPLSLLSSIFLFSIPHFLVINGPAFSVIGDTKQPLNTSPQTCLRSSGRVSKISLKNYLRKATPWQISPTGTAAPEADCVYSAHQPCPPPPSSPINTFVIAVITIVIDIITSTEE